MVLLTYRNRAIDLFIVEVKPARRQADPSIVKLPLVLERRVPMPKGIVQIYSLISADDEAERTALRPLG